MATRKPFQRVPAGRGVQTDFGGIGLKLAVRRVLGLVLQRKSRERPHSPVEGLTAFWSLQRDDRDPRRIAWAQRFGRSQRL